MIRVTVKACSWSVTVDGKHLGTVHDHGYIDYAEFYATTGVGGLSASFPTRAEAVAAIAAYVKPSTDARVEEMAKAIHSADSNPYSWQWLIDGGGPVPDEYRAQARAALVAARKVGAL